MTKPIVFVLALVFSAASAGASPGGLRAFYCIHAERPCKETTQEIPVSAAEASALSRRALSAKDDFVGFVDPNETTLQFYVEEADSILVDMPMPQMKGSYATHVNRAQALKLIAGLSPPLARYRSELKLKFAKWP